MKPRLRLICGIWFCESQFRNVHHMGTGTTPAKAFEAWRWAV